MSRVIYRYQDGLYSLAVNGKVVGQFFDRNSAVSAYENLNSVLSMVDEGCEIDDN